MSLADLKKKQSKVKSKILSVDDFIEDAQAYARGESILDKIHHNKKLKLRVKRNKSTRAKHATFSLSENCIVQLAELAQETGINKSKLIRMLVNQAKGPKDTDWSEIPDPDATDKT
jgi:hypothetical protein